MPFTYTKDPATCTHTEESPGHWVDNPYYGAETGGFPEPELYWVEGVYQVPSIDVYLHYYTCTQCGLIRRY